VFTSIKAFPENLEVAENELIPLRHLDDPFKGMAWKFCQLLEQFRLLTCRSPGGWLSTERSR
jgi:hypothetical protein